MTGTQRPRSGRDGVGLLTIYLVLLVAVPSRLVIGPLGGAGSPAMVLGLGLLVLWCASKLQANQALQTRSGSRVKQAAALVAVTFAVSYVVAASRPINPEEMRAADLGLVTLAAWLGTLLFAHDTLSDRSAVVTVLRRLVLAAACLAALGLVQWVTGEQLVDKIRIPGLSSNSTFTALTVREGFNRPQGTALHPIEFGAVLTMALPLALTLAVADRRRTVLRRWVPVGLLAMAITVSISRSAILCAALGTLVVLVALPAVTRRLLIAVGAVFAVLVFVSVPGLSGTILGLFTNAGEDSSVASRTGSYSLALVFFQRSPLLGRGFGTFLPRYRIFDDQYLLSLIEVGLVGVAALLVLLASACLTVRRAWASSDDDLHALAARGLLGSAVAGAAGLVLFDGFSFPMGAGLLFLVLGLCGATGRLAAVERSGHDHPAHVRSDRRSTT